jgi:hypothetical protein
MGMIRYDQLEERRTFASRFRHHQSLQAIQKADASPFSPLDTIHTFHVPCADMNCAIRAYDKTETVLKQAVEICRRYPAAAVYQREQERLKEYLKEVRNDRIMGRG